MRRMRRRSKRGETSNAVRPASWAPVRNRSSNSNSHDVGDQGVVPCIAEDCPHGKINPDDDPTVVRFTTGYLTYRKFGPFFEEKLLFPDGRKRKFSHGLCSLDHAVNIDDLTMDLCVLCGVQFYCEREPRECTVLVETGHFHPMKGGRFVKFVRDKAGVVHWACARTCWNWQFFKGLSATITEEPLSDSAA